MGVKFNFKKILTFIDLNIVPSKNINLKIINNDLKYVNATKLSLTISNLCSHLPEFGYF